VSCQAGHRAFTATVHDSGPVADRERESLPIGTCALGARVHGRLAVERLTLNEKTPVDRGPGSAQGYDHGNRTSPSPGAFAAHGDGCTGRRDRDPARAARLLARRRQRGRGLRARGAATADIAWSGGAARRIVLTAGRTGRLTLRSTLFAGGEKVLKTQAGGRYVLTADG
jgi:hypothetical protein